MTQEEQMGRRGSIDMKGTLPNFQDDSLDQEVRAIINAIADIYGKITVRVKSPHRYRFGCFDIILALVLLAVVIGAGL